MNVRDFIDHHYLHYNARELKRAAHAYEAHIQAGGRMFVTLAGAMSTARIGRVLARAIDAGLVHGISCTGANLEEDAFNLLAASEYEEIPNWRALSAEDEEALYARGMNRVTDTCIPETVMRHMERELLARWAKCSTEGISALPSEHLLSVLAEPQVQARFQEAEHSWLLAAQRQGVPIFTPGWEDSTTGNMFAAAVYRGELPHHRAVVSGTEQMVRLMRWYEANCRPTPKAPSIGFFQIGGGIAGDFAICAVPAMIQDLGMEDTPFWGYFCQTSDAVTSYGGYSGAPPNEKITWGKLEASTPKFMIESDATIVAPLIFAYLLGD
ncbi:MAG: deoxyhypusine synthase [Cognaticolwellia sp.]|jgi:deoxyhypusine synthase